jgi:iron complex transport system substrate-binding protein
MSQFAALRKKRMYDTINVIMQYQRAFFAVVVFSLLACAAVSAGASPQKEAASGGPAGRTGIFVDSTGRRVELPAEIKRIAPSGGVAQMFLTAIAPDLFCAVTAAYTPLEKEYLPRSVTGLPVVGQFYGQANFNPEEIAAIAPDLIIDVGQPKESAARDMDAITHATGIPAVHITADLRGTAAAFRTLGKLLGREEKGEALAGYCERTLALAEDILQTAGEGKRRTLYCLGSRGLNIYAKGSFHSEILDWMTENIAVVANPSSRGTGNESNMEQILLWDPDVVIFAPESVYGSAAADPVWKELRAVRNGAFFKVPQGPYNWVAAPPSINRFLGILWLGTMLYPQYARYDLYRETAEYYRLFYGYALSREQFELLTGPR